MNISVDDFKQIIRKCRSKETSGDPEKRSDKNPSYRQCLVTALLANDFLWLDVYAEKVRLENNFHDYHYFNKDIQNTPIRFCEEQFAYEKILVSTNKRKSERKISKEWREVILEMSPKTKQRYEIFKHRFEEEIASLIS